MEKNQVCSCSICLQLLEAPVTLLCGHTFCKSCIEGSWDREEEKNIFKCPQCKQIFTPRPPLQENTMLAEIVEEMKKAGGADLSCAGPEDVACDVCSGRKRKAHKSCLMCLVSYCEQHLQPHVEAPAFRRHKLVPPSKHLQEIICSQHDEEKKMFCRTDQQVICALCAVDQHKDHDIVSAAGERREREKDVDLSQGKIQQKILAREKEVKCLQEEEKMITVSADKAVQVCQETLKQHIQELQRMVIQEEQQIRSQQESEVARVQKLQEQLEQEIAQLKKNEAELQQLPLIDSHAVFLQSFYSHSEVSEDVLSSSVYIRPHHRFDEVAAAVSASRDRLQALLRDAWPNISLLLAPWPRTRAEFLRFSQDITLDPNTAEPWLMISDENRRATYKENYSLFAHHHHPDKFNGYPQVLSKEPLCGRCYWEVERTGDVAVSVSFKNISRSGQKSENGCNDKSWGLYCQGSGCSFRHNNITTKLAVVPPSRVGVYLDDSAGLLSFYSVSETMTLLHRVQTSFSQPLHAGLHVCQTGSWCKIVRPQCEKDCVSQGFSPTGLFIFGMK